MKYLQKGSEFGKKEPDLKRLLNCKEYKDLDQKKHVNLEIKEWAIPVGKNLDKGIKLIMFLIAKNSQEEK